MTDFEKYIQQNKSKWNKPEVNPAIWLSIENEMLKSRSKRRLLYLRIVSAAAIVLFGLLHFGDSLKTKSLSEQDILAQYNLEEHQFMQQVALKKTDISNAKVPSRSVDDFQVLLEQLEFLDRQYLNYLAYIKEHDFQPFIGDQLLNYYRSKIKLLDRIQKEIEKVNYYEDKYPSKDERILLDI